LGEISDGSPNLVRPPYVEILIDKLLFNLIVLASKELNQHLALSLNEKGKKRIFKASSENLCILKDT